MRVMLAFLCASLIVSVGVEAQTRKATPKKAPTKTSKKAPARVVSRIQAEWKCPAELGRGVATGRRFCDVLTARDPKDGILITVPPHRGPVKLMFELHNRHTYSAELVKQKQAYRKYTATVGVLSMDNTLIDRAVVQSEFRSEKDLFDRISGGAGPGGVKVASLVSNRSRSFSSWTKPMVRWRSISKLLQNSMQFLVYSVGSPFGSKKPMS